MLWQYVNLMSWIVSLGEGDIGVVFSSGFLMMHRTSGLSLWWYKNQKMYYCTICSRILKTNHSNKLISKAHHST